MHNNEITTAILRACVDTSTEINFLHIGHMKVSFGIVTDHERGQVHGAIFSRSHATHADIYGWAVSDIKSRDESRKVLE